MQLHASLMLESRTFQMMLKKVLDDYHIDTQVYDDGLCLLADTAEDYDPDLIFIGKESAIKAGMSPTEFISHLRQHFTGPILLVSTDQDIDNIEHYVNSGVTDVFSPTEFVQIDNFVSNFVSFKSAAASETKAKVLLVEDSKAMTSMVTDLFEKNNIEVMFIPTGREALTVLHFEQIDLVITDYMLEGDMTGLGLIRNIRRTTQWYSLPILAITGYNDPERNKELMRNGVSDILHKPFDIELFLIKCQNLIRNKRTFQRLMDKQQELAELLQTDPSTGLLNRQYLIKQIERVKSNLAGSDKHFHLIHIDCDNFKLVNEEYGHVAADGLIRRIGEFIKQTIGESNTVARLEGDEFMVLLPSAPLDTALQIADMVREGIAQRDFDGIRITVSVGVTGGDSESEYTNLHQDSDRAIGEAKLQGKNKVILGQLLEF